MSSIRIFILGTLEERGPMHGHQLRLLAEQELVSAWTDITVGGLYGAIKRLATEELIEEIRVERQGSYPQRQVWAITAAGRISLNGLRLSALREIVIRPDPFDLAMTRLDRGHLDDLPAILAARIATLSAMLDAHEAHVTAVAGYLTVSEKMVMKHRADRLRTDIAWHQELGTTLPEIVADERLREHNP